MVLKIAAVGSYCLSSVPIHFPTADQFYCYALLRWDLFFESRTFEHISTLKWVRELEGTCQPLYLERR